MLETAMVFDINGRTLFWHEPPGRSGSYLPDSRGLWQVLWDNRLKGGTGLLAGVAHTHPWIGEALPSHTDLTTFRALDLGLGQELIWPIVTLTDVLFLKWNRMTEKYEPAEAVAISDLEELRNRSKAS